MDWRSRISRAFISGNNRRAKAFIVSHFGNGADLNLNVSDGWPETFFTSPSDKYIGKQVPATGGFEFDKFEMCVALLGANFSRKLLLDVGANVGTTCIPAVKRGIFEHAIAFEPGPLNHSLLLANVAINGLIKKIDVHPFAIGNKDDEALTFELSEINSGDHRVRFTNSNGKQNEVNREVVSVKSKTLDYFTVGLDLSSTFIWVDVQGSEGHVLAGATETLRRRPAILLEFWPYGLQRSGGFDMLKSAIQGAGYTSMVDLRNPGAALSTDNDTFGKLFTEIEKSVGFTDLLLR